VTSLGILVPTRNRVNNAVRLAEAVKTTVSLQSTKLIFIVDHNDPEKPDYLESVPSWAEVHVAGVRVPNRMGPVLNYAARIQAGRFSHLGFMGDDHVPRTAGWDEILCSALEDSPGVAYGNDLHQGGNLPTAAVISSRIVRALGYMAAPPLEHLYIDDFWKQLGYATSLVYRPDVIIEHMHPDAGKALRDEGYGSYAGGAQMAADGTRFTEFTRDRWPGDLVRLRKALEADVD
jgi:hypothetical protein